MSEIQSSLSTPGSATNFWPDTWVFYYGNTNSSGLPDADFRLLGSSNDRTARIITGRATPKPSIALNTSCILLFDGVLYNRRQLLENLSESVDSTIHPAELLIKAYRKWGEEFPSQLKGCYSFILWDSQQDLLIAVRDAIGIYPLFYAHIGNSIYFSLSIEAMLKKTDVPGDISLPVLADFLSFRWPRKDETFYQSILRVLPGHLLRLKEGKKDLVNYWNPVRSGEKISWIENDIYEQFTTILDRSINDLLGFGNSAIFLSGGLDSVTVAALAADNTRQRGDPLPNALSLAFPEPSSEEVVQRGVANSLKLPHYITHLEQAWGENGMVQSALELSNTWPAPMLNIWRPVYQHLAKKALEFGCQVVLTGTGGDEWLGLTPLFAADLIRKFDISGLNRLIRGYRTSFRFPIYQVLYRTLWTFGTSPLLHETAAQWLFRINPDLIRKRRIKNMNQNIPAWLTDDPILRKILVERIEQTVEESLKHLRTENFYLKEISIALDHSITSMDLEEEFENNRRLGIPILGLYQHQDVVDFLFRVHPEALNTGGPNKGLVRNLLSQRFPDLGFQKQKKIDANSIFRSQVLGVNELTWQKYNSAPALVELGIVDKDRIHNYLEMTRQNPKSNKEVWLIWHILDVESWASNKKY